MANLTSEQQLALNFCVANPQCDKPVLINAVAGSGKTTMLTAIAAALKPTSGLYLAYNKAIATEASSKFPASVNCSTTHSLAYRSVVPALKAKIDNLTWRDLPKPLPYPAKCELIELIRKFCLSSYLDWADFSLAHDISSTLTKVGTSILEDMYNGKRPITHDFYLKVFHIWLANEQVTFDTFDILMLDEAGDLNEVTLEIFKLLPAHLKIAVGDQHQNIYTFNHTINCFSVLDGHVFNMSQSFRVSPHIATEVQSFCRKHLDPAMVFVGTPQDRQIITHAYISRTNASLISKMIECNLDGTHYTLARKASELFKLPLLLCGLKHKGFIAAPEYKSLQDDVNFYFESSTTRSQYKSVLAYLKSIPTYEDDFQLQQALTVVLKYGKSTIIETYQEAKSHEQTYRSKPSNYLLCTAHSSKGLEMDSVELAPDMDTSVTKAISKISEGIDTPSDHETLNLFYVACTRASIELKGTKLLNI